MLRILLTTTVVGAALASVACGGDAFTAGSASEDSGTVHDASPPPDAPAPPIDAVSEPPPSCAGNYACVPAVPTGWTGPIEVYSGSAAPPACTTDFAPGIGGYAQPQVPTPMCGCACGPSMITCGNPTTAFYPSTSCSAGATACADVFLTPNQCTNVNEVAQCSSSLLDITLMPGSSSTSNCTAQPARSVPPYSWGIQARGCVSTVTPEQIDCSSGQVCAPKPAQGFEPRLCITHDGDVACPGGGYGAKRTFYASADDTRDCTACTCGPPSGGSCDFSVTTFTSSDTTCTGGGITYGSTTKCAGVQQPADFRLTMFPTPGSCAPSTSSATGAVTPKGPVTVCCPQ